MTVYAAEFAKLAVAHLLAVASPGPDFAMVLRQSLAHGRRTAVWTSLGIGSAILLHATYCVLGLGLLLQNSPSAFAALRYAGAAYLAYLGLEGLRSRARIGAESGGSNLTIPAPKAAFVAGFLTNALNPKAALFFIALFPVAVSPETPKLIQAGYGLWMSLATMAWFSLVSVVFTRGSVRQGYLRHGHWIERALGVVFLAFAAGLLLA
jgi:RhtB (resistance to homoserine/threonine) family protein